MTSPRTTRRFAVGAVVTVWILVCGGLAWATHSALRLERREDLAARRLTEVQAQTLALSRLDAVVAPIRYRESARPYSHYRHAYKPTPTDVILRSDNADADFLIESPLAVPPTPEWILLHFMVTEAVGHDHWGSPQFLSFNEAVSSAAEFPAARRSAEATPQNWYVALLESQTLSSLLGDIEASGAWPRRTGAASYSGGVPRGGGQAPAGLENALSSTGRVALLLRNYPAEQCVSERVAQENLDIDAQPDGVDESGCVNVTCGPMEPVWLDVAMDGQWQLALVRTVNVASAPFCALQGVLIDWPRLRAVLLGEIRQFLPDASLVPIPLTAVAGASSGLLMTTLPVRLETGQSVLSSVQVATGRFGVELSLAWIVTIAALMLITYWAWRYVSLAERRMRFVSAVTHELRTPLTTFQLYVDLIADDSSGDAAARRGQVDTLRSESRRLGRIVENVLAYSRMGNSPPQLSMKRVSPGELFAAVRTETASRCADAGKRLTLAAGDLNGVRIETDDELVVQILTNLVDNACKYSAEAEDDRIWLDFTVEPDGTVRLAVEDAGGGVPGHLRRAIFRPFRRADKAREGGIGLGLALSRYWAECLGGRLVLVRGEHHADRYTRFSLSLPVEPTGQ